MGYLAYIIHVSATDKIHASSLLLTSFGSVALGIINAFVGFEKDAKPLKTEALESDLQHDVD